MELTPLRTASVRHSAASSNEVTTWAPSATWGRCRAFVNGCNAYLAMSSLAGASCAPPETAAGRRRATPETAAGRRRAGLALRRGALPGSLALVSQLSSEELGRAGPNEGPAMGVGPEGPFCVVRRPAEEGVVVLLFCVVFMVVIIVECHLGENSERPRKLPGDVRYGGLQRRAGRNRSQCFCKSPNNPLS